jgi:hypothetical protein
MDRLSRPAGFFNIGSLFGANKGRNDSSQRAILAN